MKEHLLSCLQRISDRKEIFLKGYIDNKPVEISGRAFYSQALTMAESLKQQGVRKNDRVVVISEKCPESIISFFGIWLCGAVAVPVCEALKDRDLTYILKDSGAGVILCEDSLLDKLGTLLPDIPAKLFSFSSLKKNMSTSDGNGNFSLEGDPRDTAFLIYTSGSTGNPKGVMLTHRNIAVNAAVSADYIKMQSDDSVMSILPYWHSFALAAEIFTMFHVGGSIFIPRNKSTFLKDLVLFRPTIVLSIPRFAEMLKRGIESSVEKKSGLQKAIFRKAQAAALSYHMGKPGWVQKTLYRIMKKLVFEKIKMNFGGCIRYFIGGGAPLDLSLQKFFLSLDIPMYQGYGLTEASPVISINAPHAYKPETSGKIIPWVTEQYHGDFCFEDDAGNRAKNIQGELLVKGPCVMKGYWKMPDETQSVLKDGWLYTGDMGFMDEEGYLVLVGRRKSLVCLLGGEKFYPEFIEERIKSSHYISQAMVVGEGRKRCSVLINLNEETARGLSSDKKQSVIASEISRLTHALETYQRPVNHLVLPGFSPEDGLLTNTMKIRRHKVLEKYKKEIENFLEKN